MNANKDKNAAQNKSGLDKLAKKRIEVFFMATGTTLLSIAVFAGAGYLIDRQFDTFPKMLIAGLLISYPITIFALVIKLKGRKT